MSRLLAKPQKASQIRQLHLARRAIFRTLVPSSSLPNPASLLLHSDVAISCAPCILTCNSCAIVHTKYKVGDAKVYRRGQSPMTVLEQCVSTSFERFSGRMGMGIGVLPAFAANGWPLGASRVSRPSLGISCRGLASVQFIIGAVEVQ